MPHPSTCGVTGANGYVGGVLAEALRRAGHEVIELNRSTRSRSTAPTRTLVLGRTIDDAVFAGLDVLIHAAYDFSVATWDAIERCNVTSTMELFTRARAAGVGRRVFISSMSSFPGCASLYGKAKMAVEQEAARLGLIVVRLGLVYGENPRGMVGALTKVVTLSPVLPVVGRGDQVQYTVHEDDLGRLIVHLAACEGPSETAPIIAAAERPIAFREILQTLAQQRGRRVCFFGVPAGLLLAGLRAADLAGLRLRVRSDSLIGLLNQNPRPDFSATRHTGVRFREFRASVS
jgi:nucleoside-diphosphate-sugar epimerase